MYLFSSSCPFSWSTAKKTIQSRPEVKKFCSTERPTAVDLKYKDKGHHNIFICYLESKTKKVNNILGQFKKYQYLFEWS